MQKKTMAVSYMADPRFKKFIRSFIALPFLPLPHSKHAAHLKTLFDGFDYLKVFYHC